MRAVSLMIGPVIAIVLVLIVGVGLVHLADKVAEHERIEQERDRGNG